MNVALHIRKAFHNKCDCKIYDWNKVKPGGNILFLGTVLRQTLRYLKKLLDKSRIVFYGTTEGHSFMDEESLQVAKEIKIVAVSNFVKQMLEEVGISVAGVVHHGLDMEDRRIDMRFAKFLEKKFKNKRIIFTASANHSRKGLDKLLYCYRLVEKEKEDAYLILHSEPTGYYDVTKIARSLGLKRVWLTNLFGRLSIGKLNSFYHQCSFYVQPSFSEGFGLPLLEAFRFDKPVIAVDASPFNEVIKQRETGLLLPLNKITWFNFENQVLFKMHIYRAEDLADAILELMSNQQHLTRMQENIRREKGNWSIRGLYPKLLDYFT